jgi:hypothetical protein
VTTLPDDRSAIAVAAQWVSRVMTVSLEMVLPGLLGLWIDGRLGTWVVFTLVGFAIGVTAAVWHLIRMTSSSPNDDGTGPVGDRGKPNG